MSKQFKNDKNYILKKVQSESRNKLIKNLVKNSIINYETKSNPLGLKDKTSEKLFNSKKINIKSLIFFYNKLSAIYRFNFGEVQLSFLWDGSSHEEYYKNRWLTFFKKETERMMRKYSFLKAILSVTIFDRKDNEKTEFQYRLSSFIRKDFNIQVFKRKGIVLHSK
ncbi:MAG: hypothetical protein CL872_07325 [Dehalococcoidaceae bacterium]|nr:hypothetical protein [Dehalococcoidaceae bacterium]